MPFADYAEAALYSFYTLRFSHFHSTQLRSSNTRFFCGRRVCLLCAVYSACSISTIQSTQCILFLFIHSICRWIADSDEAIKIIHLGMYFLWLWNWNMKIAPRKRFNRRHCVHLIAGEYWICLCILWFIWFIFCLLNQKWVMKMRFSCRNFHSLDLWLRCVAFRSLIYSVFINSAANKRKMDIHHLNSIQLSSWWIFRMLFLATKWTENEYKTSVHTAEKPLSQTHTHYCNDNKTTQSTSIQSEPSQAKNSISSRANPVISKSVEASGFHHSHTEEFMCPGFSYWWASIREKNLLIRKCLLALWVFGVRRSASHSNPTAKNVYGRCNANGILSMRSYSTQTNYIVTTGRLSKHSRANGNMAPVFIPRDDARHEFQRVVDLSYIHSSIPLLWT